MPLKDRGNARCPECGTVFKRRTNGATKYCSQVCAAKHIGRQTIMENRVSMPRQPETWIETPCEHCGETVNRRRVNVVDSGHIYCSVKCAIKGGAQYRGIKTRAEDGTLLTASASYSRAKRGWRTVGGKRIFFRSRMEANYARFLTYMGELWEYEPKTFWFEGIKQGVVSYTPDFLLSSRMEYVETKGWLDKRSKTKLKRMAKYFPAVVVKLVDWNAYRAIEHSLGKLIPDWEWEPGKG